MSFHVHDIVSSESIPDLRTRVREAVQIHLKKLGRESLAPSTTPVITNGFRLTRSEKRKAKISNLMTTEYADHEQVQYRKVPQVSTDSGVQVQNPIVSSSDRLLLSKIVRTKGSILIESRRLESLKLRLLQARKTHDRTIEERADGAIEWHGDTHTSDVSVELESLREEPSEVSCHRLNPCKIANVGPENHFRKIKHEACSSESETSHPSVAVPIAGISNFRRDYRNRSLRAHRKTKVIKLKDEADYMGILNRTMSHKLH